MKLLLIEGVPGSGKTTATKTLYENLKASSVDAQSYVEEAKDHPVHPISLKKQRLKPEFPQLCLAHWQRFVDVARQNNTVHLMEGSAFQSTIRFMMECESEGIPEYFAQFETIVSPLKPALIYLRPEDAVEHSQIVTGFRGEDWTNKVARYETSTPFATRHHLAGVEGMHIFWSMYANLCDSLFQNWTSPKTEIRFKQGNYHTHISQMTDFLAAFGPLNDR